MGSVKIKWLINKLWLYYYRWKINVCHEPMYNGLPFFKYPLLKGRVSVMFVRKYHPHTSVVMIIVHKMTKYIKIRTNKQIIL